MVDSNAVVRRPRDEPTDDRSDLGGIKQFSRLDSETLRNLEERCLRYEFAANQTILDCGYHAQHDIYVVIRGTVRIVNYAPPVGRSPSRTSVKAVTSANIQRSQASRARPAWLRSPAAVWQL